MIITTAIISVTLMIGAYFLFRDTLNRIQYLERLGIYWITRNTATNEMPRFSKAFMRTTSAPYWRGRGVQVRYWRYVTQVGRLTMRVDSLHAQISDNPTLVDGVKPKDLRKW